MGACPRDLPKFLASFTTNDTPRYTSSELLIRFCFSCSGCDRVFFFVGGGGGGNFDFLELLCLREEEVEGVMPGAT